MSQMWSRIPRQQADDSSSTSGEEPRPDVVKPSPVFSQLVRQRVLTRGSTRS